MKEVNLIYAPLLKGDSIVGREALDLDLLTDSLKLFGQGLELVRNIFPEVDRKHSLGTSNYLAGNAAKRAEQVLHYITYFSGENEHVIGAAQSFIDTCGIPYAIGGNSEILKNYLNEKGKKFKWDSLSFMEPYHRKIVVDLKEVKDLASIVQTT